MRIKKVSQTTSTLAQVIDGYSESTTDSYSCNYVNGIQDFYSTNEVKTRKVWINNLPIYRKVIEGNMSQSSIAHNISDIDEITNICGIMYNPNSGKYFSIPSTRPTYPEYQVGLYGSDTEVIIERASNVQANTMLIKIIIEYTKTTDFDTTGNSGNNSGAIN